MNPKFPLDYYRMTGEGYVPSLKSLLKILFRHNLRFMYFFRRYEQKKSILYRIPLYRMSRKYGLEISADARIGEGLYLGHPYNITVAGGTVIGKNVNLHKGCTIGRENRGKRTGVPVIGDRVYVGINAVIVGNVSVGSDVLIAPNSFVNFDVPDHTVVVGNPGVIRPRDHASECYVNFIV